MISDKNITLPLNQFLDILLRHHDNMNVEEDLGMLIKHLDKDEQFTHVELPSAENKLFVIRVWRIKDWNVAYEKFLIDKKRSEEHRIKWNERRELIKEFAFALELLMPELSIEEREERARHYIETRNVKIAKMIGVIIPPEILEL